MKSFYFGAWGKSQLGHHLHAPGGSSSSRYERLLPFKPHILDAALLPPREDGEQVEGIVHRSVINGWTVLSFWDRSADSRFSSSSAFVLEGVHDFAGGLNAARVAFPEIFTRFGFELQEAKFDG